MLRSVIAWLNTRFPEQLTVSVHEYKELRDEMGQYNRAFQGIIDINTRLTALEGKIQRLNAANGFIEQPKGSFKLER